MRWGPELHDKFLIEHFVRADIKDIVKDLNKAGYEFKEDWFDPFFEFRFPLYGMVEINGMHLELRAAIEPWNVLGEEMSWSHQEEGGKTDFFRKLIRKPPYGAKTNHPNFSIWTLV